MGVVSESWSAELSLALGESWIMIGVRGIPEGERGSKDKDCQIEKGNNCINSGPLKYVKSVVKLGKIDSCVNLLEKQGQLIMYKLFEKIT
jgi:hypothetical protein